MKNYLMAICLLIPMSATAYAEQITLKDGRTVEGQIIEKNDRMVKIMIDGTPLTFFKDQIVSKEMPEKNNNTADQTSPFPKDTNPSVSDQKLMLVKQMIQLYPLSARILARKALARNKKTLSDQKTDKMIKSLTERLKMLDKLDKIREELMLKHFSEKELQWAVNLFSSPEYKAFMQDRATARKEFKLKTHSMFSQAVEDSESF